MRPKRQAVMAGKRPVENGLGKILLQVSRDIGAEDGRAVTQETVAGLDPLPGAYVLLLRIDTPAPLPERFGGALLPPGLYAYCGSARGPGGLRARLSRHFRRDKTKRWHIDWLTTMATEIAALAVPGGDECTLRAALARLPGTSHPVPGFGSSDCRDCPSHLVGL